MRWNIIFSSRQVKEMALLLNICGESPEIFSSEQVELPAVKVRGGSLLAAREVDTCEIQRIWY